MGAGHRCFAGAVCVVTGLGLALSACGAQSRAGEPDTPGEAPAQTVSVTDNHGTIEVPLNPERVIALDNRTAQILSDWDVELVAAPKGLFRLWPEYAEDPDILDVGSHREPELEQIVAADPDLIITGGRFGTFYEDLRELNPNTIDLSEIAGAEHSDELARQVEVLGQIFDREEEAAELVAAYETAVAEATEAYNGQDSVIGLITSGGQILYAAPGDGRSVGVVFPTLDLQPAIGVESQDSTHGDDVSVELIADANPDWLIVLDRDALFEEDGYVASRELIAESEALQNVTAVHQDQIIYLSGDFYLTEGIHAYTDLYNEVARNFSAAG